MSKAIGSVRLLSYAILILGITLSGCATVDPKVVKSKTSEKSIVVATNVESSLNLLWIGTTVFNNEQAQLPVPDLRLNDIVLNSAVSDLKGRNSYQAVSVIQAVNRADDGFLRAFKGKADFLLLIEPDSVQERAFNTNQFMKGIGVIQRSTFGSNPRAFIHAAIKGELYDLQTYESLGRKSAVVFLNTSATMETGPKIPASAMDEVKESATARTKAAVSILLDSMGLK